MALLFYVTTLCLKAEIELSALRYKLFHIIATKAACDISNNVNISKKAFVYYC